MKDISKTLLSIFFAMTITFIFVAAFYYVIDAIHGSKYYVLYDCDEGAVRGYYATSFLQKYQVGKIIDQQMLNLAESYGLRTCIPTSITKL